jgi:CBS domain-containing protein
VLPVLGDDDRVVGMVSRGDLLRAESPPRENPPAEKPSADLPPE